MSCPNRENMPDEIQVGDQNLPCIIKMMEREGALIFLMCSLRGYFFSTKMHVIGRNWLEKYMKVVGVDVFSKSMLCFGGTGARLNPEFLLSFWMFYKFDHPFTSRSFWISFISSSP